MKKPKITLTLVEQKGTCGCHGQMFHPWNGYFDFIEQFMGSEIHGDEMNFSVLASK